MAGNKIEKIEYLYLLLDVARGAYFHGRGIFLCHEVKLMIFSFF